MHSLFSSEKFVINLDSDENQCGEECCERFVVLFVIRLKDIVVTSYVDFDEYIVSKLAPSFSNLLTQKYAADAPFRCSFSLQFEHAKYDDTYGLFHSSSYLTRASYYINTHVVDSELTTNA